MSRVYSEFLVTSFLFKTPKVVIIGSMVFLCAFCVYAGLEVLARVAQLLFPFFVLPIFFFVIVMAPDYHPGNIFPILEQGVMPPIKGGIVDTGFIADMILMAFLLPFLKDPQKGLKSGLVTVASVTISLVIVNLVTLFVLGVTTALKTYPVMNVSRLARVGGFIENMEAIVMAVWIAGAFVKLSVFFYVIVLGLAQLLNLSDYKPVVWPIGILVVQFAFWSIPSMMRLSHYDNTIFPFFSIIVQILIPLMLLVIAFIWKRKKKRQVGKVGVRPPAR
ncbi:spore germination protein [Bacillus freudenreichii]|nr:spore germination protein [Bacillus freudenreichii]